MDKVSGCFTPLSKDLKILPTFEDLNACCELSADPLVVITKRTGDLSLRNFGTCLSELPSIQDDQELKSGSYKCSGKEILEKDTHDIHENPDQGELDFVTSEEGLRKSAAFPYYGKNESHTTSMDGENEDEKEGLYAETREGKEFSESTNLPRSQSTCSPAKLVSALKGNRVKQGIPPMKMTVKWAPDVYDPPPSAVSHVPSSKNQRQRTEGRKHGKNKSKGGGRSSRGSKGKEKKQSRNYVGSSNRCFKSLVEEEGILKSDEPPAGVDFDIGKPDPFCGHSFLKNSISKLHFPVAEAT